MNSYNIRIGGDCSILVEFGNEISPEINDKVTMTMQLLKEQHIEGVVDYIPAFSTLLIQYDPRVITYNEICKRVDVVAKLEKKAKEKAKRIYVVPVCYGGEFAPDLHTVAKVNNITENEVIKLHSSVDYRIYMLGFLPGFCYLGGLDERLHTPRLENPRISIPAGSVGIGGSQTGIYPLESPGGWQLIGRTPIKPYDPREKEPILFTAGDYVRFKPIMKDEYEEIKKLVENKEYKPTILEGEM